MTQKLKVVLVGRSATALRPLSEALAGVRDISCSTRLISDGHAEVLSKLEPHPDVMVLRLEADHVSELTGLAESRPDSRPPLIVVGPAGNADAARLAVRSGARDFLAEPVRPDDLIAAIEALRDDPLRAAARSRRAELIAVIGAAGGVGTSMVACNLALAIATTTKAPTLLLDLDVNAAPLASFLDLSPERGLPSALAEVEQLDEHSLPGYVAKHPSGLRLMGMPSASVVSARDLDPARFAMLMGVLSSNYRYIVADASHALDDFSVATLSMARTVVLVLQQSVVQLKQASRMLGMLCNEVGISRERILVVVNRHLKHATVALDDVRHALNQEHLTVLASRYKSVLASIDGGIPMLEHDPSSDVTKAIIDLQQEIVSGEHVERHGLLRRALPIFSGG